jgi:predicted RNA-binding Zn-ribbon protein involved in translation (DUF1610 family)
MRIMSNNFIYGVFCEKCGALVKEGAWFNDDVNQQEDLSQYTCPKCGSDKVGYNITRRCV